MTSPSVANTVTDIFRAQKSKSHLLFISAWCYTPNPQIQSYSVDRNDLLSSKVHYLLDKKSHFFLFQNVFSSAYIHVVLEHYDRHNIHSSCWYTACFIFFENLWSVLMKGTRDRGKNTLSDLANTATPPTDTRVRNLNAAVVSSCSTALTGGPRSRKTRSLPLAFHL